MTKPIKTQLKRTLSLPITIFYGVGTIIGAGIYVLIGKVAAVAGIYLPIAFIIAGIIAVFTAFSYAELSVRYPQSSGAAIYVYQAWHKTWLFKIIGWLIVFTGIVSAATISRGFIGYLNIFIELSPILIIVILVITLMLIAMWGIKESAILITTITLIEIGGLIFVIATASQGEIVNSWDTVLTMPNFTHWSGILLGSFLAFYAFIGFEDMVNIVEEVKNPKRNLPLAIIIAVSVSITLYVAVAIVAVLMLPIEQLANSKAPLAELVVQSGYSPQLISLVSLVAVVNGALVQIIMASRVLYGMARKNMTLKQFGILNSTTQTPLLATLLVAMLVLMFALWLPLVSLAKITSFIMLIIFTLVNLALVTIKLMVKDQYKGIRYPIIIPILGSIFCLMLIMLQLMHL